MCVCVCVCVCVWLHWVFAAAAAFSSCRVGATLVVACRLLIVVASLAAEHRL